MSIAPTQPIDSGSWVSAPLDDDLPWAQPPSGQPRLAAVVPGSKTAAIPGSSRRRRPRIVYALAAVAGVLIIALTQILLSSATTADSYYLAELTQEQNTLGLQAQAQQDELYGLASPQRLASYAADLGMIVAGAPVFLRLSDGTVIGTGGETGWKSSINTNSSGAVSNALLEQDSPVKAPTKPDEAASNSSTPGATNPGVDPQTALPQSPAPLSEGLPTPQTR